MFGAPSTAIYTIEALTCFNMSDSSGYQAEVSSLLKSGAVAIGQENCSCCDTHSSLGERIAHSTSSGKRGVEKKSPNAKAFHHQISQKKTHSQRIRK